MKDVAKGEEKSAEEKGLHHCITPVEAGEQIRMILAEWTEFPQVSEGEDEE